MLVNEIMLIINLKLMQILIPYPNPIELKVLTDCSTFYEFANDNKKTQAG